MKYIILTFSLSTNKWGLVTTNDLNITNTTPIRFSDLLNDGWQIKGQSQDENRIFYTLVK